MIDKLHKELSCKPPGPDRANRQKRLDQRYDFERLVKLKTWWNRKA